MNQLELNASIRNEIGSRASRRLRRAGSVPAILYGAKKDPLPLFVNTNELKKKFENEAFGSSVLDLNVNGSKDKVILKAVQRHPVNSQVTHLDFLRVSQTQKINLSVPIHFINEDTSPAKQVNAVISHLLTEVEVSCLPGDLPEAIVVDMSEAKVGDTMRLSELVLPDGVEIPALTQEQDQAVSTISMPRSAAEEEDEVGADEDGEEASGGEESKAEDE